jgi:hypothetical protein
MGTTLLANGAAETAARIQALQEQVDTLLQQADPAKAELRLHRIISEDDHDCSALAIQLVCTQPVTQYFQDAIDKVLAAFFDAALALCGAFAEANPHHGKWRSHLAAMDELRAKEAAEDQKAAAALREAKALLSAGEDPRTAEEKLRAARTEAEVYRNRAAALKDLSAAARNKAVVALENELVLLCIKKATQAKADHDRLSVDVFRNFSLQGIVDCQGAARAAHELFTRAKRARDWISRVVDAGAEPQPPAGIKELLGMELPAGTSIVDVPRQADAVIPYCLKRLLLQGVVRD